MRMAWLYRSINKRVINVFDCHKYQWTSSMKTSDWGWDAGRTRFTYIFVSPTILFYLKYVGGIDSKDTQDKVDCTHWSLCVFFSFVQETKEGRESNSYHECESKVLITKAIRVHAILIIRACKNIKHWIRQILMKLICCWWMVDAYLFGLAVSLFLVTHRSETQCCASHYEIN